jgi:transcriptional regulator with XRE-family HTH domain
MRIIRARVALQTAANKKGKPLYAQATDLGIAPPQLSEILHGIRNVEEPVMERVAKYYNLDVSVAFPHEFMDRKK